MNKNNDIQWTPEIEAEMPKGLTLTDQYKWRRNKENELRAKATLQKQGSSQTTTSGSNSTEKSETSDKSVSKTPADNDLSNNEIYTETEKAISYKPAAVKKAKAGVAKITTAKKTSSEYKPVRGVHKSVLEALDRLFPGGTANGDMIAAVVYIVTNGDCEVSEKAMQLVESYGKRDGGAEIFERLSNIERMLRDNARMLQSVELCTCYNTFDRRYGSKERRVSPKDTEFREQGNLDMLDRLRRQADDQRKVDCIERSRDIYDLTKDKNYK